MTRRVLIMEQTEFPKRPVGQVTPLITAGEGYPALEKLALDARHTLWLAFRVFDPDTALCSDEAGPGTWRDLLERKLAEGVSVRLLLSDFDPIGAPELHEMTWRSVERLRPLASRGDIEVLPVRHEARVGKGLRFGLWAMAARAIETQRKELNKAGKDEGARIFRLRPGLWRYLRQNATGRFRWRSLLLPRLFPATLHHKIAVADGAAAIIGGLDVNDRRYDDPDHDRPAEETWHDASVLVDGPIAGDIARHIARIWNDNRIRMAALRREQLRYAPDSAATRDRPVTKLEAPDPAPQTAKTGGIQLLRTLSKQARRTGLQLSPKEYLREIENAHIQLFANASRRIYIETQYFRSKPIAEARLVAIGMAFAIVTQSSSATVAAALTALNTGLIDLGQGACIVIGADVGTTVTAALATLGASTGARRTGLSHVIYNAMTGVLALLLVGPYLALASRYVGGGPEVVLVAFHTGFNFLGVLLVLPFTRQFARCIERLIGGRADSLTAGLDERLLEAPALALDAVHQATTRSFQLLVNELDRSLGSPTTSLDLDRLQHELDALQDYLDRIEPGAAGGGDWERLRSLLHALDHLQRLHERLDEEPERAQTVLKARDFDGHREAFVDANRRLLGLIEAARWAEARVSSAEAAEAVRKLVKPLRAATSEAVAAQALSVDSGTDRFEAVRWLRRVSRHLARVSFHLERAALAAGR